MPQFVFIDHSLKGIGGHEFDYACHVLREARAEGFETIVATHRKFARTNDFPHADAVYPSFRNAAYCRFCDCGGIQSVMNDVRRQRIDAAGWASGLQSSLYRAAGILEQRSPLRQAIRRRMIRQFAEDCETLFQASGLPDSGHVFFANMSELDLLGLTRFLSSKPQTRSSQWHVQFHFNIFEGRDPEYGSQPSRWRRMQTHLKSAVDRVPGHALRFYCTTDSLARQYNRLGVADFKELAYPINAVFSGRTASAGPREPLRLVCAGGVRKEKGHDQVAHLVDDLWNDYFAPGRLQLVLQARKMKHGDAPRLPILRTRNQAELPTTYHDIDGDHREPIRCIRHPLPTDQYVKLIKEADIGLFLYDSRRYFTRRAGVLGEYLCAGVPVIVPAGSWLAEQIAEPTFRHIERQISQLPALATRHAGQLTWSNARKEEAAQTGLAIPEASVAASESIEVPPGAQCVILAFQRGDVEPSGRYVELDCIGRDANDRQVTRHTAVVGPRKAPGPCLQLFPLSDQVRRVSLRIRNAFEPSGLAFCEFELSFHRGGDWPSGRCPMGSVGLTAAGVEQFPQLLDDMLANYAHYRQSAENFRSQWFADHDPRRTVAQLLAPNVQREAA